MFSSSNSGERLKNRVDIPAIRFSSEFLYFSDSSAFFKSVILRRELHKPTSFRDLDDANEVMNEIHLCSIMAYFIGLVVC